MSPDAHKNADPQGCYECGLLSKADFFRADQDEVIERFKKVHGDRFDYSKVRYRKNGLKVAIECRKHGVFWQTPINHDQGKGCIKCRGEATRELQRLPQDEVIARFRKAHGDKYDYSLVEYKGYGDYVTIICPEHGKFDQTPGSHVAGTLPGSGDVRPSGCPDCSEYGYKSSLPGSIYITYLEAYHLTDLLKAGITNYSPETRMKAHSKDSQFNHAMVRWYTWEDGSIAQELEREIKKGFERNLATHKFDGSTETYHVCDYEAIIKMIEHYHYRKGRKVTKRNNIESMRGDSLS